MHRQRGTLLLYIDKHAAAEGSFYNALSVAKGLGANLWELRAARDLDRLWRNQGKRQQALDLLTSVYDWFTEGLDTWDLKQWKALLEERPSYGCLSSRESPEGMSAHEAADPGCPHICPFRGQPRNHLLVLSITGFDPTRTWVCFLLRCTARRPDQWTETEVCACAGQAQRGTRSA